MNVFDLMAKITLDTKDYENDLDGAGKKTSNFADKLKSGLKTAAKVGAAAVTAASTAIGVLTKQSIDGYANYEQLIGGVDTLFNKTVYAADNFKKSLEGDTEAIKEFQKANKLTVDGVIGPETMAAIEKKYGEIGYNTAHAAEIVKENAANAYKSAGMSANEYMETVTSFSASLIQSLGGDTEKAAEVADRAITDMADNANKMGTSMESIQYAYNGFAKQNYTMLDNLKLGYGGTKEEMERLIEDAAKMTDVQKELGIEVESGNMSFANIANAISVVQKNMGIMGTTAKEASETISGSVASAKASWQNLLVGFANDEANLNDLIGQFVESVKTAAGNVIPALTKALTGIGEAENKSRR